VKISILSSNAKHHKFAADLFAEGLKKHNRSFDRVTHGNIKECDLLIGWGYSSIHSVKKFCKDFLMMEAAYLQPRVDDNYWPLNISLGYNGLNGYADFLKYGKDSSRWEKHYNDGRLKDWKKEGEYILVTGQMLSDWSIKHLKINYPSIVVEIEKHLNLPVIFKPHPRGGSGNVPGKTSSKPLTTLLKNAKAVVTVNSNSGVDSILEGVPVLALDRGSMCWDICMRNYVDLLNITYPERDTWLHELSWCQWFYDEISSGEAWEHLKRKYE